MFLYGTALADTYVLRTPSGDYIRVFDEPCPQATGWLKMFRAEFRYQGKLYASCWVPIGEVVIIFSDDGTATPVPAGRFVKEEML